MYDHHGSYGVGQAADTVTGGTVGTAGAVVVDITVLVGAVLDANVVERLVTESDEDPQLAATRNVLATTMVRTIKGVSRRLVRAAAKRPLGPKAGPGRHRLVGGVITEVMPSGRRMESWCGE